MPVSLFSASTSTVAGPRKRGDRLKNGDSDGKYWMRGNANGSTFWRGPFNSLAEATNNAKDLIRACYASSVSLGAFGWASVGKRYWRSLERRWLLLQEYSLTDVEALPNLPDPDAPNTAPPVSAFIFGRVTDKTETPTDERFITNVINIYWYNQGDIWNGNTKLTADQVASRGVYWQNTADGYAPYSQGETLFGPVHLQDEQLGGGVRRSVLRQFNSGLIYFAAGRPLTAYADDTGADGVYLAGYQVRYRNYERWGEKWTGADVYTERPVIQDRDVKTLPPGVYAVPYAGPNPTGNPQTFFKFGVIQQCSIVPTLALNGAGYPASNDIWYTPAGSGTELSAYIAVSMGIRAVYVTRSGDTVTYSYSSETVRNVTYFPYRTEPFFVDSRTEQVNLPLLADVNGNPVPAWRSVYRRTDVDDDGGGEGGVNITVGDPVEGPISAVGFQWDPLPNAEGYVLHEYWGTYDSFNPANNRAYPYSWEGEHTVQLPFALSQSWGYLVDVPIPNSNPPRTFPRYCGYSGSAEAYPIIPVGVNGNSAPYPMPRPNARHRFDRGIPAANLNVGNNVMNIQRLEETFRNGTSEGTQAGMAACFDYYTPSTYHYANRDPVTQGVYFKGTGFIYILDPLADAPLFFPPITGETAVSATPFYMALTDGRQAFYGVPAYPAPMQVPYQISGDPAPPGQIIAGYRSQTFGPIAGGNLGYSWETPVYATKVQVFLDSDDNLPDFFVLDQPKAEIVIGTIKGAGLFQLGTIGLTNNAGENYFVGVFAIPQLKETGAI